jgi:hydroxyacylglutathione hydrolase
MSQGIKTITLALPLRMGTVNCYLVRTDTGFVLIDTGSPNKRAELQAKLESAGCRPGNLELIIITHGDFDHTGNAAYLRKAFGAKLAMHGDDSGMTEHGDMLSNRMKPNIFVRLMSGLVPILFGFGRSKRFTADLFVEEGYDLSAHGFDARVLHIPGHSSGSLGILSAGGDFFCGDLFENRDKPVLNSIIDDPAAADASVERLRDLEIKTIYPGHGTPFPIDSLWASWQAPPSAGGHP